MVAARKRENQNRINYKTYLFRYGKENFTVLNQLNLINILTANGPKRKPHIQLRDGLCIQFVPFYLSYVGTGKPTKTLCDCARAHDVTEILHFLNRKLIIDGNLRYCGHKSTFEDKLNDGRQTGAGMQFHFINICLCCFKKGACAFIVYVRKSGFS